MDGMSPPSNRTGFRRDSTTTAHRPGSRQSNGSRRPFESVGDAEGAVKAAAPGKGDLDGAPRRCPLEDPGSYPQCAWANWASSVEPDIAAVAAAPPAMTSRTRSK